MTFETDTVSAYKNLLLASLKAKSSSDETPGINFTGASIVDAADGALEAFKQLAGESLEPSLRQCTGSELLTERALILGLQSQGRVSANGTCHLMPTATGWIALNLARDDDWELIPAWLERDGKLNSWQLIETAVITMDGSELVNRGRLMGLPVAEYKSHPVDSWYKMTTTGQYKSRSRGKQRESSRERPVVLDLSSLWAGPLCSHLLQNAGARVIKVESENRPDTTRDSIPAFNHLINGGKLSVFLDFSKEEDIASLHRLIECADIVIEASRPRVLQQFGINAETIVQKIPGITWISITGYGRDEPQSHWVAFGDDAAVAGGVAAVVDNEMNFVGDALADPLTGIHAALIALSGWQSGQARLVDIALAGVASYVCQQRETLMPVDLVPIDLDSIASVASMSKSKGGGLRNHSSSAHEPGSDTSAVLKNLRS